MTSVSLTSSDLYDLRVVLRMEHATDDARLRSWTRLRALARNAAATHKMFLDDGVAYCGWLGGDGMHDGCGEAWPCSTVRGDSGQQIAPPNPRDNGRSKP